MPSVYAIHLVFLDSYLFYPPTLSVPHSAAQPATKYHTSKTLISASGPNRNLLCANIQRNNINTRETQGKEPNMEQQPLPRLRTLMSELGKLQTQVNPSGFNKKGARAAAAAGSETPSPRPGTFDEQLCQEMATALFRYKALIPLIYFRDVKVCDSLSVPATSVARPVL